MASTYLIVFVALIVLCDLLALRFGADSREWPGQGITTDLR